MIEVARSFFLAPNITAESDYRSSCNLKLIEDVSTELGSETESSLTVLANNVWKLNRATETANADALRAYFCNIQTLLPTADKERISFALDKYDSEAGAMQRVSLGIDGQVVFSKELREISEFHSDEGSRHSATRDEALRINGEELKQLKRRVTAASIAPELLDVTEQVTFTQQEGPVEVDFDSKVVTRTEVQQGNAYVLIGGPLNAGQHKLTFNVITDLGSATCIGLVRYPFISDKELMTKKVERFYHHRNTFLYRSYEGGIYLCGDLKLSLAPLECKDGNTVELVMYIDMEKRQIAFYRNGTLIGNMPHGLNGYVQPVIAFYAAYEKCIKLVKYEVNDPRHVHFKAWPITHSVQPLTEELASSKRQSNNPFLCFDRDNIMGEIHLNQEGNAVFRDSEQSGNSLCMLNKSIHEIGKHQFSFHIEIDKGASTCIGVTRESSVEGIENSKQKRIYESKSLYVYRSYKGMLYSEGEADNKSFKEFHQSGTLLDMTISLEHSGDSTVTFSVNNEQERVAFTAIEPPMKPVVAFYQKKIKRVELVSYHYSPYAMVHDDGSNITDNCFSRAKEDKYRADLYKKDVWVIAASCMTCNGPINNISLPCGHATFCTEHVQVTAKGYAACLICQQPVTGIWNVLN
ncbi:hypothetical protein D5R81_16525 [Parashewanella spongiae]|uniref:SPRY domain-containing protein n=1 Tax=Parashewanella spongiae TaxID=342950 RepID=A0A3A6TZN2_9GAMM|nr:SPRY domain-containing protein [Parashewanella spongiae]MCL1079650.1 hypothetical protein [Parashewanella spongiae]RJY07121.1 hypothetical protein D5R81_16525 [Parashewanella spongiae]